MSGYLCGDRWLSTCVAQSLAPIHSSWAIADTDPLLVLVHERYRHKDDFITAHRTSAAFLKYKAATAQLASQPVVTGQSYIESEFGFM